MLASTHAASDDMGFIAEFDIEVVLVSCAFSTGSLAAGAPLLERVNTYA